MSTKTIYKRIALVAVASLGAGLLSVAPASATSTGTSALGPIRVSFTGTNQDTVERAAVTITADSNWQAADVDETNDDVTFAITLTQAPTALAQLSIAAAGDTGTVVLGTPDTLARVSGNLTSASVLTALSFGANVAGTYRGTIVIDGDANTASDLLTVPFVFTTVGAPASFDFVTTTAGQTSSAVSGAISVTVTLRDAANNITQGSTVDTIALTAAISAGGTVGTFANPGDGAGIVRATDLADGTSAVVYTNSVTAASTSTLTATPRGTLGALAAKTLTVTTVSASTGVPTATIATSNTTIRATTSTSVLNKYTVSTNQTSVTFNVTGLTPNSAFSYDLTASSGTFTSVNTLAYTSGDDLVGVSTATGTFSVVVVAASPGTQTITLDLNTDATADVTGQVDADFTYAAPAYAVTVTTPAATPLFRTSSAITYTGRVADQFGNVLAGASVLATGTPTPATTPSTITATAVTAADGTYTVTLPAVAATTTSLSTVVSATSAASISSASANVAYFTATGIAATLVLTDSDSDALTLTTDNKSTRTIVLGEVASNNVNISDMSQAGAANAANWVSITPQTTSPASVGYSVTATNGIRLFANGATMTGALGLANTAAITGTGGQEFFAVPTKVGAGVITVVSGGLTQTFTLTGVLATAPKANLVTLAAGTVAGSYTVTATDLFGNGVVTDVAISVSGPGAFGNGFKNLTVTTAAVTGQNTFSIVSDGSAPTVVTASIAGASNYIAITAANVVTYGLTAASAAATSTLAGKGSDATGTTLASLTTLINSLIAKINALNKLVIKIQKKVRA
jgi:hypothetical protein